MSNSLGPVKRTKEARQEKRKAAKGVVTPLGEAIEFRGSDSKPVWRYTTVNQDGELNEMSKAYYPKSDLEDAEKAAGSQFNWRVVAYKTDGNKLGQPILDPKIAVSLLTAEGKENLIDKVYHVDQLRPKTSAEGAATEPSVPADPSTPGGKIGMEKRMALEMYVKTMRALNPSERTEEEKRLSAFNKQFGFDDDPNADLKDMTDDELRAVAALCFTSKYTGENVTQILAEKNTSQSAPALPDQTPQTPPPVQATSAPTAQPATSRRVWQNPQDGAMVDLDTGLSVQAWKNPQSGDLIDLTTGEVVQLFQPGQPAANPTQPNPAQSGQPTVGTAGSPVVGPQGGTAGSATSTPVADVPFEELLKRPDLQLYLDQCVKNAVKADRKARKDGKRQRNQQNQQGNGNPKGGQQGGGNA